MSETIVRLPDQATARIPKDNYITRENGLLSWLLTSDHKRIAILYLISITFFFEDSGKYFAANSFPKGIPKRRFTLIIARSSRGRWAFTPYMTALKK